MSGAPVDEPRPSLIRRFVWFVALWVAGVLVVGLLATALRWILT